MFIFIDSGRLAMRLARATAAVGVTRFSRADVGRTLLRGVALSSNASSETDRPHIRAAAIATLTAAPP
jgi:hypothetical protein